MSVKGDDNVDEVKRHEIDDEVRVVVQASKRKNCSSMSLGRIVEQEWRLHLMHGFARRTSSTLPSS